MTDIREPAMAIDAPDSVGRVALRMVGETP